MAIKEKMNMNERFKYLRMMKERYEQADRQMRELLLDEMEMMTSLHRKYLIKRMNGSAPYRRRRRRERSRTYGADVDQVLSIIGDTLDWICAERLIGFLPRRRWSKQPGTWPSLVKWRSLLSFWNNSKASAFPPCVVDYNASVQKGIACPACAAEGVPQ